MLADRKGFARLVATASRGTTHLTTISHRAPGRLLPMRSPLAEQAGAGLCVLGSFGGGLLGGDSVDVSVHATAGTTLTIGTQASTKVYRMKPDKQPSRHSMRGCVDEGALLVYAPDPLVPFAHSAYVGTQRFELQPGASLVTVDWLSSGRASCGERWAFESYESRTELRLMPERSTDPDSVPPVLVEALHLPRAGLALRAVGFDIGGVARDATVSMVVVGPRTSEVVARLHDAAAIIAQRRRGGGLEGGAGRPQRDAREGRMPSILKDDAATAASEGEGTLGAMLLGDLMLGVCDVEVGVGAAPGSAPSTAPGSAPSTAPDSATSTAPDSAPRTASASAPSTVTVARLVAEHNEDVYRLLHYCLSPLQGALGTTPYSDRIHAVVAAPPTKLEASATDDL
jgi:urease accessory protein UreH